MFNVFDKDQLQNSFIYIICHSKRIEYWPFINLDECTFSMYCMLNNTGNIIASDCCFSTVKAGIIIKCRQHASHYDFIILEVPYVKYVCEYLFHSYVDHGSN